MFICRYKMSIANADSDNFEYMDTKEFETTSANEALQIIEEWNRRGKLKNEVGIKYKYELKSALPRSAYHTVDKEIVFHTRANC